MTETSGSDFRSIALPFAIFTVVWGSTWIVILGQLGIVPGQWSVTYRFAIAAIAMAILARIKGRPLILDAAGYRAAVFIGMPSSGSTSTRSTLPNGTSLRALSRPFSRFC